MMSNQNNNNYDEYDQKTSSSCSSSSTSSSISNNNNQQEQILNHLDYNLESQPPNKKFAINNIVDHHQTQPNQLPDAVKLKPQLINNKLNRKIRNNHDLKTTNHFHHPQQQQQQQSNIDNLTTAALLTSQPNDFMQNLLLRTLTEILTNQLMLTRKVDLIKDNVDIVNRRLTGKSFSNSFLFLFSSSIICI
jgi:hypothetical protein